MTALGRGEQEFEATLGFLRTYLETKQKLHKSKSFVFVAGIFLLCIFRPWLTVGNNSSWGENGRLQGLLAANDFLLM